MHRVQELERAGRLEAAATLAEQLNLHGQAARLWEKACDFRRAAEQSLCAGKPESALVLAARIDAPLLFARSLEALSSRPELVRSCAERLKTLGFHAHAARLYEQLNQLREAAELNERARLPLTAARQYCSLGDLDAALRSLESELPPGRPTTLAKLARAQLFEQSGQLSQAASALQKVPEDDPLLSHALTALARVLAKMGIAGAARETLSRLVALTRSPPPPLEELADFSIEAPPRVSSGDATAELLLGRYEMTERVASTATARVYKAYDRVLERHVAVKWFSPMLLSGTGRDAFFHFEREVSVLRELNHPAVVPLLAYHPEGPQVILAWMPGGSLAERLARGPLPPSLGALIVARVLSALAAAHRRGVLHRDIKPANILFDERGAPYLADFGTAHVADHAETVTQGVIGTLAYMAPAQRRGDPANVASDIYSVGAVFWQILTGAPPEFGYAFLSEELSPEQRCVAQKLIDPQALPDSALSALALVEAQTWPSRTPRAAAAPPRNQPRSPPTPRLVERGHVRIDTLLERPIELLEAKPSLLERARLFAVADHPGLASVLKFDTEARLVWLESLPRRTDSRLARDDRAILRAALARLHEVGGFHGVVDLEHVGWRGSQPVLLFPCVTRSATLAEDLAKLERLR